MSTRASAVRFLLLACAAFTAACTVVDPVKDLKDYTDTCQEPEHCADGFTCFEGHCLVAPAAQCQEGFSPVPCELSAGVCAGVERACVNGRLEARCSVASYGPTYEALETSCTDGLDNDCDGLAEVRRPSLLSVTGVGSRLRVIQSAQVARFGTGYLVAWIDDARQATLNVSLLYALTDAQLRPIPGTARALDSYPLTQVPRTDSSGTVSLISSSLTHVELVPYDGGVLVLWSGRDEPANRAFRKVARVELASGAAGSEVALAARELPLTEVDTTQPLRAAVAADRSSVLLTWVADSKLRGQAFSLDLAPLSAAVTLSGPLATDGFEPVLTAAAPQDISPNGSSSFALAWGSDPSRAEDTRRVVRFRTVSSTLEQLGEVVGSDISGKLNDLRLLAALAPGEQPLAAWLAASSGPSATATGNAVSAAGLNVSRPFGSEGGTSRSIDVPGLVHLNVTRDGEDLLMAYPEAGGALVLRRVSADGSTQVRPIGAVPDADNPVNVLVDPIPGMWTVVYSQGGQPYVSAACRL